MLESKYKRLEYIQSTGTQYIDTGIIGTGNLTFDFRYRSAQNNSAIFGARVSYNNRDLSLFQVSGGARFDYFSSHVSGIGLSANTINRVVTEIENNDYVVNAYDKNDVLLGTKSTIVVSNTTPTTIKLFGIVTNGTFSGNTNCKIYYFKIYDNGILVRNFIPVLRKSDNEIGMLDLVEGKFYPNAGTGKFTANLDTMYALIQGTPTVQDGRVSGFSETNYLTTNQVFDTSKDFEIVTRVIFTTMSVANTIIRNTTDINSTATGFKIALGASNNKIRSFIFDSDSNAISNGEYGVTTFNSNIAYLIKFSQIGNIIKIESSSDNGTTWVTENAWTTQNKIRNTSQGIAFGRSVSESNQYLRGTIDLNRSYIKIDDTKYKLQAVVGYTVVGSPTITDGVVSGFSSSNYLITNQSAVGNRAEFKTRIIIGDISASSANNLVFFKMSNYDFALALRKNSKKLAFYRPNAGAWLLGQTVFSNNDIVEIKYSYDGQRLILYSKLSNTSDYIKECEFTTNTNPLQGQMYLGRNSSTSSEFFNGSIDLNSTYIKINNKLWFNGLEA
jgi:hypothetical protein